MEDSIHGKTIGGEEPPIGGEDPFASADRVFGVYHTMEEFTGRDDAT